MLKDKIVKKALLLYIVISHCFFISLLSQYFSTTNTAIAIAIAIAIVIVIKFWGHRTFSSASTINAAIFPYPSSRSRYRSLPSLSRQEGMSRLL
ncbi:unnamed protein product [Fusarium langsethiae]|nr:unnamed protein product [Fusarium langsethiae]